MINKASEMYVSAGGLLDSVSTAGNNFEITQLGKTRSFWIDPTLEDTDPLHAAADGTHIVTGWPMPVQLQHGYSNLQVKPPM